MNIYGCRIYDRGINVPVSVLLILSLLLAMTGISGGVGADTARAASKTSLRKQYEKKKKEADSNQNTAEQLAEKIKKINKKIEREAGNIEIAHQEITAFDKKIESAEKLLSLSEKERKKEKEVLYDCIRILYESGEYSDEFSALVQSGSYMNYINREQYRSELLAYIKEKMTAYQEIEDEVEEQKDGLKDYDKLKFAREEELIEYERKQEEFDRQLTKLSSLVEKAKKKAKDAAAFAKDLEKQVALMEEQERKAMEKKSYAGGSSDKVTYSKGGTDYYEVGAFEYTDSELTLMASIIEAEAGSTSYPNMIAVGSVIMNRVASSKFPNTIEGVIYASGQFEPVRTGRLAAIMARGPAKACVKAAKAVLEGKRNVHNFFFKAAWYAKKHGIKGVQIGDNVFH